MEGERGKERGGREGGRGRRREERESAKMPEAARRCYLKNLMPEANRITLAFWLQIAGYLEISNQAQGSV